MTFGLEGLVIFLRVIFPGIVAQGYARFYVPRPKPPIRTIVVFMAYVTYLFVAGPAVGAMDLAHRISTGIVAIVTRLGQTGSRSRIARWVRPIVPQRVLQDDT